MDGAFPRRKEIRLKQYDYSQPGYYFVTICTAVRNRDILCHIHSVGGTALGAPDVTLTAEGVVVAHLIENMEQVYHGQIHIDCSVVMPDHIHLLVSCKPQLKLSDAIKILKGNSARWLFLNHPELKKQLWGGHLWNPSYFVVTVSERSMSQVKAYIQSQKTK